MKKVLVSCLALLSFLYSASCALFPQDDDTDPTVSITSPAASATVSGTVVVKASASDDSEIFRVVFYLDDNSKSDDRSSPYEWSWNTADAADGVHVLKAVAFDASGNSATSAPVSVTVANGSSSVVELDFTGYPVGAIDTASGNIPDNSPLKGLVVGDASLSIVSSPVIGDSAPALRFVHGSGADDGAAAVIPFSGGSKGYAEFTVSADPGADLSVNIGKGIPGVDTTVPALMLVLSKGSAGVDVYWTDTSQNTKVLLNCIPANASHDIRIVWDLGAGVWGAYLDGNAIILNSGILNAADVIQYFMMTTSSDLSQLTGGTYYVDDISAGPDSSIVVPGYVPPPVLAAPSGLSASASSSGIELSWTDESDNETGFVVLRGPSSTITDDWETYMLPADTESWTDASPLAGETWYYRVYAYIFAGGEYEFGATDTTVFATMPSAPPVGTEPADGVYVAGSCKPAGSAYKRAVIWHDDGSSVTPMYLTAGTASDAGAKDVFIAPDAIWACGFENKTGSTVYNAVRWKIDPDGTVTQTTLGSGTYNMIAKGIAVSGSTVYTVGDDWNVEGIAAVLWTDTVKSYLTSSTSAYYAAGNSILYEGGYLITAGTYDYPSRNNAHYWVRGSASDTVNVNSNYSNTSFGYDAAVGSAGVYVCGSSYQNNLQQATVWLDSGSSFSRIVCGPAYVTSYLTGIAVSGSTVHGAGYANVEGSINEARYWTGSSSIVSNILAHPGISSAAKDIARSGDVSYISGYWTLSGGENVACYWTKSTSSGRKALTTTETSVSVERIAVKNPVPDYTNDDGSGGETGGEIGGETGGEIGGETGGETGQSAYPAGLEQECLVGWWSFDGSPSEASGSSLGGTAYGTPVYGSDRFGVANKAIVLDGSDDYISVASTTLLSLYDSSFTMSVWMNLSSFTPTSYPWLLFKGSYNGSSFTNGYSLGLYDSTEWRSLTFFSQTAGSSFMYGTLSSPFSTGTWAHVCVSFDNTTNTLYWYYNGELVQTSTTNVFDYLVPNSEPLLIGRGKYLTGNQYYFNGSLDDVRIFHRLISSEEASALYHEGGYGQ